jgi:pyridoxamine 5'-phosphate oxidase
MTSDDPIATFTALFDQAKRSGLEEPEAMVLSTVDKDGRPSSRYVLLKELDARGFVFYTNLESRKARALAANPYAALCFYWPPLDKQVRIEGDVERVTDLDADAYFATRPRESQLGAWASKQSSALDSRASLEQQVEEARARFEGRAVPRPPYWSGYRVIPHAIEFWTRHAARLHDRSRFTRENGQWRRTLLYP